MSNKVPDFIYSITVASILERYLTTNLALETISYKHAEMLATMYEWPNDDDLQHTSELFLHTMADANVGDQSELYLIDYEYNKFTTTTNGKARNWKPLFGNPLQGTKKIDYNSTSINKNFKAFIYNTKRTGRFICPTGWKLNNQTECSFLSELSNLEITPFDLKREKNII
jgi:hypothetical protein